MVRGRSQSDDAGGHGREASVLHVSFPYEEDKQEVLGESYQATASLTTATTTESVVPIASTSVTPKTSLSLWHLTAILSTAFSYGCILTTLFIITLPVECERIHASHPDGVSKSVALGLFVAIAGLTQLVSPFVGRLSDVYVPPGEPTPALGQRMPYLMLGSVLTVAGLLGQMVASYGGFWIRYSVAFFCHMIGLNVMYAMMIALIPDQVPSHQTGVANGVLALLLVTGSLTGFALFHSSLIEKIQSMYGLYICMIIPSSILTGTHAHDQDVIITERRLQRRRQQQLLLKEEQRKRRRKKLARQKQGQTASAGGGSLRSSSLAGEEEQEGQPSATSSSLLVAGESTSLLVHQSSGVTSHESADNAQRENHFPYVDPLLLATATTTPQWKRKARRAAKRAQQIALTPALVLKSMWDPVMDPATWINMSTVPSDDDDDDDDGGNVERSHPNGHSNGKQGANKPSCSWTTCCRSNIIWSMDVQGVHHDFFVVTVSRLFYYCGMSVQTFFLYYLHDIIGVTDRPQEAVAFLAVLGQVSGAFTCYPVGVLSDSCFSGRRVPFVYAACFLLSCGVLAILFWARTFADMEACCLFLGAANGMYLTMETSLAVDALPKEDDGEGDVTPFVESLDSEVAGNKSTMDEGEISSEDSESGSSEDRKSPTNDQGTILTNGSHLTSISNNNSDNKGSAQLLGIWGVAAFLGSALGPMLGGPLLFYFGRQDSDLLYNMTVGNRSDDDGYVGPPDALDDPSSSSSSNNFNDDETYGFAGYVVVLSLSAFYFLCSAFALTFLRRNE